MLCVFAGSFHRKFLQIFGAIEKRNDSVKKELNTMANREKFSHANNLFVLNDETQRYECDQKGCQVHAHLTINGKIKTPGEHLHPLPSKEDQQCCVPLIVELCRL